ncbi:MAG TPA: DNA topoisomerase VI subunit B [Candidatus Polarisedimenticolaceae bacterium]|nr:DNA topoisomerase VI subunit B [Candidatus Polarisedimenticolaceae bacterium]
MAKKATIQARSAQLGLFEAPIVSASPKSTPKSAPAPVAAKKTKAEPKERREDATSMAARQRDISISEFFTKNRHLLGFDNPQKALLTAIKEAVDNSLDACEEAGILPELIVEIQELGEDRFRIAVEDNGPGIVQQQIPKIFGKLLYGSKFHRLKQQRGQQGIGISAAGMYGMLTTGKPVRAISKIGPRKPAHLFEIAIDTQKNAPVVHKDVETEWDKDHGTRVEIELEATYKKGRRSVDDYVEQTALANPHVTMRYVAPKEDVKVFERVTQELPVASKEIKPHPYGVELGILLRMAKDSASRSLRGMLSEDFSRVSSGVADQICKEAGLRPDADPRRLSTAQVEALFRAVPKVKIMAPPTACLSPIGQELLEKGLQTRVPCDFATAVTRPPSVYRGNPFQVEIGLAYGGQLPAEELMELYRFANRVPLQYQQSACAITKAATSIDWRSYGLQQSRGALPAGPAVLSVHIASVWVPFTSESKEAVASYPEIVKEIRLGLMEAGRRLGAFVRHRRRVADEEKKRSYIEKYIPHIADGLQQILGLSNARRNKTVDDLKVILEKTRKI